MSFFGCCEVPAQERGNDGDRRPRRSAALGGPQGTKAGIGCVFHADAAARKFRVAAMLPGPAKASGKLEIGDTLYAVDGRIVHPANTADLPSLIIGPAGSTVALTIHRADQKIIVTLRSVCHIGTCKKLTRWSRGEITPSSPDNEGRQIHVFTPARSLTSAYSPSPVGPGSAASLRRSNIISPSASIMMNAISEDDQNSTFPGASPHFRQV